MKGILNKTSGEVPGRIFWLAEPLPHPRVLATPLGLRFSSELLPCILRNADTGWACQKEQLPSSLWSGSACGLEFSHQLLGLLPVLGACFSPCCVTSNSVPFIPPFAWIICRQVLPIFWGHERSPDPGPGRTQGSLGDMEKSLKRSRGEAEQLR